MKTNIYFNATNEMSRKDWTILRPESKEIRDEIATRHANFNEDKKASAKQFERVYKDWLNVYRMRPVNERIVKQFNVDTAEKLMNYIAPTCFTGRPCKITAKVKDGDEVIATRTDKKGNSKSLVIISAWTVSVIESLVKYSAEYYANVKEDTIVEKFNKIGE